MIYQNLASLMMFALNLAFKFAAGKSLAFQESLKTSGFAMQINVGRSKRRYLLEGGRWRSTGADGSTPDLLMEWTSLRAALGCLVYFDPAAIIKSHMDALTDGRLSLEVDMSSLYQLGLMMNQMKEALSPDLERGEKREKAYAG
jgi:hypothetical protein